MSKRDKKNRVSYSHLVIVAVLLVFGIASTLANLTFLSDTSKLDWRSLASSRMLDGKSPIGLSERPDKSDIVIDSINVKQLDGRKDAIRLRGQKKGTIIYVFDKTCKPSLSDFNNVRALAAGTRKHYRFIGLALTGIPQEFPDAKKQGFPIYLNSNGNPPELKLGIVPQTIVISPKGIVLKSWIGAYSKNLKPQVEKYFGIRLPEVAGSGLCINCLPEKVEDGLYSPGAGIKSGGRRLHCKFDGMWGVSN